uniref:Uncharacterized protein n=1 Tax=Ciona savignyi TaxID=51511 RepID=H2ZD01_CIOSA
KKFNQQYIMSLFGNSSGSSSKNLVEFRAGKMFLKGTTVSPDKRKGQVYVYQADDNLMHFCWKDRTSGRVEDDLIIFPDDCELKKVAQCKTGRVFLLTFKSSSRKLFFWMQVYPNYKLKTFKTSCFLVADKDDEYCKKVNDSLNNPPQPGQGSGVRPQTPAVQPAVQLSQLQDILFQMGTPKQEPKTRLFKIDLADAITPDAMIPILADQKVVQERLKPFLPEGQEFSSTEQELRDTVRSPQLRQAISSFGSALASGQLAPLLAQFGLPEAAQAAASKGDVEGFAKAMQEPEKKASAEDEEEEMSVD